MGRVSAQDRAQTVTAQASEAEAQLSVFVDSSVWFAAGNTRERRNERAKRILIDITAPLTTDHVLVETWLLMERLGITHAASFDDDFAIYRYGRNRERGFAIVR
jgi:predicted nucleic acid-binding protein